MKKFLLALLFIIFAPLGAQAADIFYAAISAGGNTGANCANARALSSHVIGDDVAGNTLHICGLISGGTNSTVFTALANGASGNPITIKFETGASMSALYWNWPNGAINLIGRAWWTVDGGVPCGPHEAACNGRITATANGSGRANQQPTVGIGATGTSNVVIKNMQIDNVYFNTQGDGTGPDQSQLNAVTFGGSTNFSFTHGTVFFCGWCFLDFYNGGMDLNIDIGFNIIHDFDHGLATASDGSGGGTTNTGLKYHDNELYDTASWDNHGHHDGIHAFQTGSHTSSAINMSVYNNYFHGDWGSTPTGFIFIEGGTDGGRVNNFAMYNNVGVVPTTSPIVNTTGWYGVFGSTLGFTQIYNNTIIGPNTTDNTACYNIGSDNNFTFKDNTVDRCGDPINFGFFTGTTTINGNGYGTSCQNGNNCFVWNGGFTGSFTAFKAACSCDAASFQSNALNLSAVGIPQTGSPLINAGPNLFSISSGLFAALASDTSQGNNRAPTARPTSGNWTIGAFNSSGTTSPNIVITPSSHSYGVIPLHSTSAPFSYVVTNNGTATLNINTAAVSGTNAADFVISSNNCNGAALAPNSGSCTVAVTFTANLVPAGPESAVLQVSGNAPNASAALSGVGQAPGTAVMTVTPNPVNFPNTNVGSSSAIITVTFTNTGNADFQFNNNVGFITVSNLNFASDSTTCTQNEILHPAASCTGGFHFHPSSAGLLSGTVSANGNVTGTTTLNGTGVNPGSPLITVTPTSHDFGSVPRGTQSSLFNFTIANTGTASGIMGTPFFTISGGTNPTDFTRVSPGGSDCQNGQTLAAGANCLISVAFTPSTGGAESATLTINSNASGTAPTAALTGTGTLPVLLINNGATIAFGNQNQGTTSAGLVVPVKNTGNGTETFTSVTLVGANPGDYAVSANACTGTLAPTATCNVTLTFTPTAAGSRPATLNVNGTVNGSQGITGTGVATAPVITIAPRPVPFPNTVITGTPSNVVVTITNTGNATQASLGFTITTGDSGDWTRASTTCGSSLAASVSCTMTFTFTPTGSPRAETTLLTITGTATATAIFNGTGVAAGPGGAPAPWFITFTNNYQTVVVTASGPGFTASNQITLNGTAYPTTCTPTACTATTPSSPVWLPFTGRSLQIGVK